MWRGTLRAVLVGLGVAAASSTCLAQSSPGLGLRPDPWRPQTNRYGLLITQVLPGSPAAMQGLETGDIIVSVNGNPVGALGRFDFSAIPGARVMQLGVIDRNSGELAWVQIRTAYGQLGVSVCAIPLGQNWLNPVFPLSPGQSLGGASPVPGLGHGPTR